MLYLLKLNKETNLNIGIKHYSEKSYLNYFRNWGGSYCYKGINDIVLTKITAAQNEVALINIYYRMRGLYFLEVIFVRCITIMLFIAIAEFLFILCSSVLHSGFLRLLFR